MDIFHAETRPKKPIRKSSSLKYISRVLHKDQFIFSRGAAFKKFKIGN